MNEREHRFLSKRFLVEFDNGHFKIKRISENFIYEIDSYVPNDKFYERVIPKIYFKNSIQNGPVLSLFLIPETCEK